MISRLEALVDRHLDTLLQFVGYVAVSGAALSIDFTIYVCLLAVSKYAFVAAAGGYVFGVLTHYFLSSRIVFRSRFDKRGVVAEAPTLAKFFAAGFTGLLTTSAVVGLLADVMGVNPLLAKIVAAGCSFCVVFTSLRLFVFNASSRGAATAA